MLFLLQIVTTAEATTYYWRGGVNNAWDTAANWNTLSNGSGTSRNTPAADDILIFDGSIGATFPVPIIVDFGGNQSSQQIGQLRFLNNANVTVAGPTTSNKPSLLDIGGGTASAQADDFFVQAGSRLTISYSGNTDNRFLLLQIGTGKKGLVEGTISINTAPSISARLIGVDAGALVFSGSAIFTALSLQGSPFGTTGTNTLPAGFSEITNANSVVFRTGTTYTQQSGVHPFGTGTTAVTKFESGSMYTYSAGTFSNLGQTYGNLQFLATPSSATTGTVSGTQNLVILNNLTLGDAAVPTAPAITVNLNIAGTAPNAGTSIGGNITVNQGTGNSLVFGPNAFSTNSSVILNGTTLQTISGTGNLSINGNAFFEINNPAGVTLQRPLALLRGLVLRQGLLNTTVTNSVSLPTTSSITAASGTTNTTLANSSFVNGPMTRITPTTATGTIATSPASGSGLFFPIGTPGNYRPISMNISQTTALSTAYTAQVIMGPPPAQSFPPATTSSIKRVSGIRYYQVSSNYVAGSTTSSAFTNGQLTIYYGTNDRADAPSKLRMAKSQTTGIWANLGGGAASTAGDGLTFVAGNISSSSVTQATNSPDAPFSSLGNFTLASTVGNGSSGQVTNPLPVELTAFSATVKAVGISLDWATASEKNNASFEVQRGASSDAFQAIATVQGQGTTPLAHTYTLLDRAPLSGLAYYRLRQTDDNGTTSYSPVVAATWASTARVQLYPNPSAGKLYVNGAIGLVQYRVLTIEGRQLLTGETEGSAGVDVKQLPTGVYLLEMLTLKGPSVQRFTRE